MLYASYCIIHTDEILREPCLSVSGLKDPEPPIACALFFYQSFAYIEFGSGPSDNFYFLATLHSTR